MPVVDLYGPRAAEGGCGPGVAGTGVWEGASVWAKTKFRSTAPIIATVTMKLKQRRECCIAFSPAFGTKSIGATRADTYTLPPLRQAESPALSRSRHRFNNDMPRRGAIFGPSIATRVRSWRAARRRSPPDAHGHRGRSHQRYGSEQGLSTA